MRSLNRNATVDTTALCKTFSGNGEESWCEATRPTTGCLYIYPEESANKLAGISRMYIGDFAECTYELAQHGHHFDNGTSFRYTKPHFAENAGTTVHRL